MTGGTFRTTIEAPIEDVWRVVSDFDGHASWSPKPFEIEWVSGEPGQVGSTFRSFGHAPGDKRNENNGEITERVERTTLAFRSKGKEGWFSNRFDLRAVDERHTDAAFTVEFPKMTGFYAVVVPLLSPILVYPDYRKRMKLLKERVEGEAAG
jgi:uncharacterized protein YndB with AHSA1/START domain